MSAASLDHRVDDRQSEHATPPRPPSPPPAKVGSWPNCDDRERRGSNRSGLFHFALSPLCNSTWRFADPSFAGREYGVGKAGIRKAY
jgi:hypothetical protein